jgi:hypothetical protein
MAELITISGAQYHASGMEGSKFPHTGPVNFEVGALPYLAAFKGRLLKRKDFKYRCFKTAEAAIAAIMKEAEQ